METRVEELERRVKNLEAILGPEKLNGVKVNGNGVAKRGKPVVDYEIPRKLLHGSIGFLVLYLYLSEGDPKNVVVGLWSSLAIIVPADILRFQSPSFAWLYEKLLGFLMRESEKDKVNGVVWYIVGTSTVLSLFPTDVACVSVLILSWADTTASTFGRLYGRHAPRLPKRLPILGLPLAPRKSFVGFFAASVTGALIAFGFWGWLAPMRQLDQALSWSWEGGINGAGCAGLWGLLRLSLFTGLVTGVAEALDLGDVDDNLSLPIISGACLVGFFKMWEYTTSAFAPWFT